MPLNLNLLSRDINRPAATTSPCPFISSTPPRLAHPLHINLLHRCQQDRHTCLPPRNTALLRHELNDWTGLRPDLAVRSHRSTKSTTLKPCFAATILWPTLTTQAFVVGVHFVSRCCDSVGYTCPECGYNMPLIETRSGQLSWFYLTGERN